jgi:tetratricopeptide (TPR) repeat protein
MSDSIFRRILGAAGFVRRGANGDGPTTSQRKAATQLVKKGIDFYNTHRYIEACDFFREAIAQDPGYARAHCYLGNTLHKLGYPEEALFEWKKAVIVEPDSDAALKAQEKLDKIASRNAAVVRDLEDQLGLHD